MQVVNVDFSSLSSFKRERKREVTIVLQFALAHTHDIEVINIYIKRVLNDPRYNLVKKKEEEKWVIIHAAINRRLREGFGLLRKMRNSLDTLLLMDMDAGVKFQKKLVSALHPLIILILILALCFGNEKFFDHLFIYGFAGLQRCGKSCRLRWINYLRPDIRRGRFTPEEEKLIISLHGVVGNRFESLLLFTLPLPIISILNHDQFLAFYICPMFCTFPS